MTGYTTRMRHFPIFLDLQGRRVVVLGGGTEALRKIELLLRARARPLVIAETVGSEVAALIVEGRCERWTEPFEPTALTGAVLAISASGDWPLDIAFSTAAQVRGIPVNVVDRPELSSFIMPAIVDRHPVIVAVSTGGASPALAQVVRDRIERALPLGIAQLAWIARKLRPIVRSCLSDPTRRRRFWRSALRGRAWTLALWGQRRAAEAALLSALRREVKEGISSGVAPH